MQKTFSLKAKVKAVAILLLISVVQNPYLGLDILSTSSVNDTPDIKHDLAVENVNTPVVQSMGVSKGVGDYELENIDNIIYQEKKVVQLASYTFSVAKPTLVMPTSIPIPTSTPTPTIQLTALVATQEPQGVEYGNDHRVSDDVKSLIEKYASEYGADPSMMIKIAKCESGFNEQAVSPSGAYHGMYQFIDGTWVSNRKAMGLDPNIELRRNAEEAIRTAAFKMGRDGYDAWPVCSQI